MKVAIVGRGRVGRGLARALRRTTMSVKLVAGRGKTLPARGYDTIIVAVPDGAIRDVATRFAATLDASTVVLHCAGGRDAELLDACREYGASVGVMHPLVSFPTAPAEASLAGAAFVIDGDRRARSAARAIASAVGARPIVAPIHGPSYHAGAALVANGAAALCTVGVALLEELGLPKRGAERAVGALLRSVADNVERIGVPSALTGPVQRGDAAAVRAHRSALRTHGAALSAYDAVAPMILSVAREAGLSKAKAASIRRALGALDGRSRKGRN